MHESEDLEKIGSRGGRIFPKVWNMAPADMSVQKIGGAGRPIKAARTLKLVSVIINENIK